MRFHHFILSLLCLIVISSNLYPQQGLWQKASHIDGGRSSSLAIDSKGNIYNATYTNGLFRSTDSGNSWERIETLTNSNITNLYISPKDVIFLNDNGIKYSNDEGKSWNSLDVINNSETIKAQTFAHNSQNVLFAGTEKGLYVSADSGKSWSPDNLFARRSVIKIFYLNNIIFVLSGNDIQKEFISVSKDHGQSWQEFSWDNPGFTYSNGSLVSGKNGKFFLSLIQNSIAGSSSLFFMSDDSGGTWKSKNIKNLDLYSLISDPFGNLLGAVYGQGILKSTDDGTTWLPQNSGINNPFIEFLLMDSEKNIYAGTNGGVIFSDDNGQTWKELTSGLNTNFLENIICDKKGNFYANTRYQGVFKSTDQGKSWYALNNGFEYSHIEGLFNINDNIFAFVNYASSRYDRFKAGYKLLLNENKWQEINALLSDMAVSSNGLIYVIYYDWYNDVSEFYSSSDNGDTWNKFSHPLPITHPYLLEINSKGDIYLYGSISNFERALSKSTNNGISWIKLSYNEFSLNIMEINSKDFIFVQADDYKILRTKDDGKNWESVNNNLPNNKITSIYIDETCMIYLTMEDGHLYYSNNDGDSWNDITYNLTSKIITSVVNDNNSRLYVTTQSNEVYYLDANILDVEKIEQVEYELSQNYPNPFNSKTIIRYTITNSGNVRLKLFDILGNEIAVLLDEYKDKGNYSFELDATKLSSGIYFYRLETGSFSDAKKFVLLK